MARIDRRGLPDAPEPAAASPLAGYSFIPHTDVYGESMQTRTLTTHVPTALADQIERIAASHDQSPDWAIHQALSSWVDVQTYHDQMTLKGIEDLEAGRFVTDGRVAEWIESLDSNNPLPLPQP